VPLSKSGSGAGRAAAVEVASAEAGWLHYPIYKAQQLIAGK